MTLRREFNMAEIATLSDLLYGGFPGEQFVDMATFEWLQPYPEGCSVLLYRGKDRFDLLFTKDKEVAFEHDTLSSITARLQLFSRQIEPSSIVVWVHAPVFNEVLKYRRRYGYERYRNQQVRCCL